MENIMSKYTDARNAQLVIALLKEYGIRNIIASPGTTNVPFVYSVQNDSFFKVYSAIDERSAAYMACGLAAESGKPVVLSCTGATASRDYMPGLTEAFYRKLPVLALTSMHFTEDIGNLSTQILDRSVIPNDIARYHTSLEMIENERMAKDEELRINIALSELTRDGGGPVAVQLITDGNYTFSATSLPKVNRINRFLPEKISEWPELPDNAKIAVLLGAHRTFSATESEMLEHFVETHDAVVFSDISSGYHGKFAFGSALACIQLQNNPIRSAFEPDLVIHVGEMTGDYNTMGFLTGLNCPVWRVSLDGEFRQHFARLENVFQCSNEFFFSHYASNKHVESGYRTKWENYDIQLRKRMPEFPFSNIWMAQQLHSMIPAGSIVHSAILSSLSSWDYFPLSKDVRSSANVGGLGIDGCTSTLIGASLSSHELCFCITGDLAFFYDMNSLGCREIGPNLRILLINNGLGMTFKLSNHVGSQIGPSANIFIAAEGHNAAAKSVTGNQSPARAWAESLGFKYLSASSKEEFNAAKDIFTSKDSEAPILFECFTHEEDERTARDLIDSIDSRTDSKTQLKKTIKRFCRNRSLIH
ncbi:2-succinyl-5-enolpyruvyl-6-hydroxy-3-cyclohexene-1-carboxylate synthase [Bifidobacterium adolescentis]|nr:2-succinyl-5-enolpyruvyl-6-hydroxy-3-cyclohexene-1-carboxylate synthase [Bifidobacterium adolescentis]KAB5837532.1 2-succinyl-5-enolpyruvyl-6-hydroxy-3-cyclohexene-1-carboxylate synthase [Bifidobacterium adolescentis]KAB5857245.1 2-succinyl-5-enolpyruvyl-6-hydroxy-3-cyclohexene-1-carboxylate synthase [Bifidobacterium adolescentis]KAB5886514.1 2-succinyl-5-enolpyruvyl-6-hydroxy-3-cyclohexene-1-carboxylate synthase [Bifidobacterium adolescentis]KAB5906095.1 2-succinyl-5-enolpyruvyl-6-hydroxy-3